MDGNTAAIDAHLAEREEQDNSRELCGLCNEPFCDCAEEAANDAADHKMQMMKEGG